MIGVQNINECYIVNHNYNYQKMVPMQRSFIFTVLFCFYLFFFGPLHHTQAQIQAPYHERYYTISNPDGVFDFQEYASPTFQQEIISASDTSIVLRVRTAIRAPELMKSHYPVSELTGDFSLYLQPTRWIQSDDPRIISVAEQIRQDHSSENLHDLVFQVMLWSARHLQYGDPSGIHDAVYALENRVVNCIGYAHLPAAMLRHLGIPARVVRTFVYRYPGFTRHYLLEVYYPEDNVWLTFEPQTISAPFDFNVFLYHDADWNQQKHLITRDFSLDPRTTVRLGLLSDTPEIHELSQFERPEPDMPGERKFFGHGFAAYGDILATLSFNVDQRPSTYPDDTHGDNIYIYIWERAGNESSLLQVIDPAGKVEGDYVHNPQYFARRIPLMLAGLNTGFGHGARAPSQPSVAINERFLVIRLNGFQFTLSDPQTRNNRQFNGPLVFFERQQDGQWDYHSTFRYPDAWYLDGRASHGELAFSPQGDLYIPGPQGVARLSYSGGRWEAVELIKGKADEGFRENARFIAFNEDGSRMIAGAPGLFEDYFGWEPSVAGFAEVFRYTSSGWESAAVLTAPDGNHGDQFGFSVAASGNRFLVGAPLHNGRGSEAGAAFLFEEDPRTGIIGKATTLQAAATIAEDQFGGRVALRGIQAFVSSHQKSTSLANRGGGVCLFELMPSGQWAEQALYTPGNVIKNSFPNNRFNTHLINAGFEMGFLNEEIVLGAPGFFGWPDHRENNYGSIYFFELPHNPLEPVLTEHMTDDAAETIVLQRAAPNPMFHASDITFYVGEDAIIRAYIQSANGVISNPLFQEFLSQGTYLFRIDGASIPEGPFSVQLHWQIKDTQQTGSATMELLKLAEDDEVI